MRQHCPTFLQFKAGRPLPNVSLSVPQVPARAPSALCRFMPPAACRLLTLAERVASNSCLWYYFGVLVCNSAWQSQILIGNSCCALWLLAVLGLLLSNGEWHFYWWSKGPTVLLSCVAVPTSQHLLVLPIALWVLLPGFKELKQMSACFGKDWRINWPK